MIKYCYKYLLHKLKILIDSLLVLLRFFINPNIPSSDIVNNIKKSTAYHYFT